MASISPKVAEILRQQEPSRVTPRLRQIWPDIEALHKAGYLYTEITGLLRVHYGIEVSYKSFASARRRIKGSAKDRPEVAPKSDPFENARQRMADHDRVSDAIAGKRR